MTLHQYVSTRGSRTLLLWMALNLAIGMMLSLMAGVAVAVSMELLSSSAVRQYAAPVRTAPLTLTPGAARM